MCAHDIVRWEIFGMKIVGDDQLIGRVVLVEIIHNINNCYRPASPGPGEDLMDSNQAIMVAKDDIWR